MDFSKLIKDKRILGAIVAIAVVIGGAAYWTISNNSITVAVSGIVTDDIAPDAEFIITTKKETTVDELYKKISFEPKMGFELVQREPNVFMAKPFKPLEADSTVILKISGKSFTYKVRNSFVITSNFPIDGSTKFPVAMGIEINFNCNDISEENFKQAIKIEPGGTVNFRARDDSNGRYVLYPEKGLQYDTKYTVTVNDTLLSETGAKLERPMTFSFTTISKFEEETEYLFNISSNSNLNVLSSEVPIVQLYLSEGVATQDINVKILKFPDANAYKAESIKNLSSKSYSNRFDIDTKALAEYAAFTVKPVLADSRRGYQIWGAQFPEALPEGHYAIEMSIMFEGKPITRQMFLQVSDLSVFFINTKGNTLLWVNDAATGKPVPNAKFEWDAPYHIEATTGEDGTAFIQVEPPKLEDRNAPKTFTVKVGDRTFVDSEYADSNNVSATGKNSNKYMSYMFTDRPIYRTTDTIHVWGVVIPRDKETPKLEKVILDLNNGTVKQEAIIKEDGTFQADINIKDMSNYVGLELKMDEETTLMYLGLRVEDFVKPSYVATTSPEKPIYLLNDGKTANINFDIATFDGTPVPDFKTKLSSWNDDVRITNADNLAADAQGHLFGRLEILANVNTWYPQQYSYRFENNDSETENFYKTGTLYAIHRDVMIKGKPDITGEKVKIDITTNNIDISKIKTPDDIWDTDYLKGEAITANVTAKLHKIYYTKESTGTYYDFINRVSKENFKYRRHDDVVNVTNIITNGGRATMSDLPKSDNENCYYMELIVKDSKSQDTIINVYLGSMLYRNSSGDNGEHRYMLNKKADISKLGEAQENQGDVVFGDLSEERRKFVDDETVTFVLEDNDEPVKELKGKILYTVIQDDYKNITISDKAEVILPYSEDLLPNYVISGAYFDGKYVFPLERKAMKYNPKQRELEVTLETDKEKYNPADNLSVTATVKNKSTGAVVENANVVISIVDEAIFALEEQYPTPLNDLYRDIYYPNIRQYTSYKQPIYGGANEKGGGNGNDMNSPRNDFKDTAHFSVVKTDKNGKATLNMKLPDNITSWRITSIVIENKDNKPTAGNIKSMAIATKDYFVLPIVNETLIDGDVVTVGLRSSGSGVDMADSVKYTVTVSGEGTSETKELTGTLREYKGLEFKPLKKGNYKVTIKGECKNFTDVMELPFEVVDTGIEISIVKTMNLKDGINVDPLKYPVNITVYDKAYETYNTVIRSIMNLSSGTRADMRLGREFVRLQYEKDGEYYAEAENIGDITDGLISLFPHGEVNFEQTAKARLAVPEMVTEDGVKSANDNFTQFEGAKSALYLAEALSSKEKTRDFAKILKTDTTLDFIDKMYLATAIAVRGDTKTAQTYYDGLVKANIKEAQGLEGTKVYYLEKQDLKSSEDCTAAALMLATKLRTSEMDGLALYLSKSQPEFETYILELLYYANTFKPTENSKSTFSYVLDGKTIKEELGTGMKRISLNKEQFEKADFKVLSGDIYADIYYKGAPSQVTDTSKKKIGFTKKVEPIGSPTIKRGGLVKVTLTPDLTGIEQGIDDGKLVINDYIPSGMRFEEYFGQNAGYGRSWHFDDRQGQRLQFTAYYTDFDSTPIVYYARCSSAGEYIVESAYISSAYSETWGASERAKVIINE